LRKEGFALALTLWIVAILSLVSVVYLSYGKKVVKKTIQLNKKLEVTFEVESTIELLKFYISTGEITKDRVINNNFNNLFPSFPTFFFIDGRPSILDNRTIILQDTAGLINIYDDEAFSNYLSKNLTIDDKDIISDSMRDWLDINDFPLLNGAETPFYKQKKYAYEARNEDYISSIEELFLIRGLDKYKRIDREKLTLSNIIIRNILTMTPQLLGEIYRFTPNEIEQLIEAKKEGQEPFLTLFYRLNIENKSPELDGFITSNILKINIVSRRDDIYKKIKLLVSFRPTNEEAFKVLEYYD
jgi:hypothetical protein